MTEIDNQVPNNNEIIMPNNVSLADKFWIDPAKLGSIRDIINSAHMTTMALGVESRHNEYTIDREMVETSLLDNSDNLVPEKKLAIDVGFLYGSMLTRNDASNYEEGFKGLPEGFTDALRDSREGLDLNRINDCYVYFMRLREIEVESTGSDLLAFCLASTQDHIAQLFSTKAGNESSFTETETMALQTLYYAGALTGALSANMNDLPSNKVQIMRTRRDLVEKVSIRLELDSNDDLEEAINYQLSNRYSFKPVFSEEKRGLAILPGGIQFGPNSLTMPIHLSSLPDVGVSHVIEANRIDGIVVEIKSDDFQHIKVNVLNENEDINKFIDELENTEYDGKKDIKAIIINDICVSAYDQAHPWFDEIDKFIRQKMNIAKENINYCNEVELYENTITNQTKKHLRSGLFIAGLIGVWIPDTVGKITQSNYETKWVPSLTATGLVLGVYGLTKWLQRKFIKENESSVEQYNLYLQQFVDKLHLPKNQNSGNIPD